jgi:hypothetical protein
MTDLPEIRPKWQVGRRFLPIVAAASTGVAVAVSAWLAVSVWEERLAKATFNDVADDYASVLQNGLDQYLGKIVAVRDECVGKRPRPCQTRAPKPFVDPLPLHAERLALLAPGDEAPAKVLERGERRMLVGHRPFALDLVGGRLLAGRPA